ncbi:MAG: hypothetical protein IIU65_05415 [Clostridia bacterium]|nr:hypothetical protein [Clostridia bacterium]
MIKINNIKLAPNFQETDVIAALSKKLRIDKSNIIKYKILKKSVDARKENDIKFVLNLAVEVKVNEQKLIAKNKDLSIYKEDKYQFVSVKRKDSVNIIIGSGPAGLFAAYTMIKSGLKPIIIERGKKIEDRVKSVEDFFEKSILDTESNIQFGEGGAGTFSDGKLNTGISDKRIKLVLETFVEFGAPSEILYENKPHIGTDILRKVIINFRKFIEENGGEFRFSTKFIGFNTYSNKIKSIITESNGKQEELICDNVVLAIGHSARDTFEMLYKSQLDLMQKPFAIGVRIEHSQEFINKIQYKSNFDNPHLPVADYKTAVHLDNGRSVFSFCMCPGGYVVAAASESNMIAVNGMSNFKRNGTNANSALLVNVNPSDFGSNHPLAGIEFQRKIEAKAYNASNSYKAPAQTLKSFLYGGNNKVKSISPTYKPDVFLCDLSAILPNFICNSLKEGIKLIDKKMIGFANGDSILTAPETRSSSPVRILRNDEFCSEVKGLYPCGEGAGYAGGITSAAVDGIKVAENIIKSLE